MSHMVYYKLGIQWLNVCKYRHTVDEPQMFAII
uniref:Uncharacterized protein n=1 Tax=Arundo donax TaxID=35708 RepID=A0A0A9AIC4_ARUDO